MTVERDPFQDLLEYQKHEFERLSAEIEPPLWPRVLLFFFSVLIGVAAGMGLLELAMMP